MDASPVRIRFTLNGEPQSAEFSAETTALKLIRDGLKLKGTKEGCGIGECGACTIIVDGKAVNSCLMLAAHLDGRNVRTIEGLGTGEALHPIQGVPYATYAYAVQLALVSVDVLTGEVCVEKIVAARDVGKAIHPENVIGQICGGIAMGLGFALMEEFEPGRTASMKDYHIPTCADMPEVVPIIVEAAEPTGPFGAKGVGEPALIPTASAILNAIADALGVRIYALPANLERVLAASITAGHFKPPL